MKLAQFAQLYSIMLRGFLSHPIMQITRGYEGFLSKAVTDLSFDPCSSTMFVCFNKIKQKEILTFPFDKSQ